jgi:hypothetical protein
MKWKRGKMFYKVSAVKPLSEYRLWVQFLNGEQKEYDVKPLFEKWAAFQTLSRVSGLFEQVHVDAGGYGIRWNDDIDLSCNELYNEAKKESRP